MKKFYQLFFSMTMTGILLVLFAAVIAVATFVENDYGTTAAKLLVYNAWWFEALLLLLAVNLTGSVFINRLLTRRKWPVAFFHLSFVIILAGAAITRHYGFEGTLHIREGKQNNQMLSRNAYLHIEASHNGSSSVQNKQVFLAMGVNKPVKTTLQIGQKKIKAESTQFIASATEMPVDDPNGEPMIAILAIDAMNQRAEFNLKQGESHQVSNILFTFGNETDSLALQFSDKDGMLFFSFQDTVTMLIMGSEEQTEAFAPGTSHPFMERSIYQAGDVGFVLKRYYPKARMELVPDPSGQQSHRVDALRINLSSGKEKKEVVLFGKAGIAGEPVVTEIDGLMLTLQYGSLTHYLPFSLFLKEFQIERYPGSNSPSSFASEVVLIDLDNEIEEPYRIFMNNILKYRGYRFFQSSYDPDEKGTILSVNYDAPGTTVTYTGYFLMTLGILLTFFFHGSRFRVLVSSLVSLHKNRKNMVTGMLVLILSFISFSSYATTIKPVAQKHAKEFGHLQVQNVDGRIEPVNTMASELLRKIYRKNSYKGLSPVQVMMGMMLEPETWQEEPLVRVSSAEIGRIIGIRGKYAAFTDFLDENQPNGYKLSTHVHAAYEKSPAQRNKFDKEIIIIDERVNILYKMLSGGFLTIFPVTDAHDNKWIALAGAHQHADRNLGVFAMSAMKEYIGALQQGIETGDYAAASDALERIAENQKANGASIYPSAMKTRLEIFYININLFSKLPRVYILVGLILLVVQFILLLSPARPVSWITRIGFWLVLFLFLVHTSGLAIRWYISGHAPWSNGYETLLYISWAACLAGLIFTSRSKMTLAVTTILAAISLFVAGMNWMSPELTNLVPVLKSYWLIIHVAVITASYGFLCIGALLGLLNLVLIIIRNPGNGQRISFTIKELSLIIEIALIIGLYLLTIGSFLGGVWANESWGRYWGWDPKETWALVTILVYAFVTHMHRIKCLRGEFAFSAASLLGFASVLMTYFGVNYYLTGLHSYAQGDPPPLPSGVYIALAVVAILITIAWLVHRQWKIHEYQSVE